MINPIIVPPEKGWQIHVENLYRSFPDQKTGIERPVLQNVDLKVKEGEFVTVVGPSGCGKSTLLKILLGQDHGFEGNVYIDDRPVQLPDSTRGLVPQNNAIYPHLTVFKNVEIGLEFKYSMLDRIRNRKQIRAEVMQYLEMVDLLQHADKTAQQLSGGQQQRVSIAQSLITQPKMIFMDEPFGALDTSTRERVQTFLLQLWDKYKMTIFFVTHDISEAVILGTRLVLLSQYYTDDRGDVDSKGEAIIRGSKIVRDIPLSPDVLPMKAKGEPKFVEMVRNITEGEGFKPDHRMHVRDFDLRHPNSFSTLTQEEDMTGVGNGVCKRAK